MCQQGPNEIYHSRQAEKAAIRKKFEAYEKGEVELTDDDLQAMAVRMLMLREN